MSAMGLDFDTQGSLTLMCFRGKIVLSNRIAVMCLGGYYGRPNQDLELVE